MLVHNTSTKVECKGFGFWSKNLIFPIQKRFDNYQKQDLLNPTSEKYDICISNVVVNGADIGKMYETASR